MRRRDFLSLSAASSLAFAQGAQAQPIASRRPNILLIMVDDLGVECIGSYGGESYATPNIDALAASGMQFSHCYSNPKCVPSRVNILTGRYGFRTGQEWGHIPDEEITFGTVLQNAGYATGIAGKWQLTLLEDRPHHPQEKGFEQSCMWAWHEGPRYWNPMVWQNGERKQEEIADRYGPHVFRDFLIDFMEQEAAGPFLAYYPMNLPHFPKTSGPYEEPPGPDGEFQTYAEMVERLDTITGDLVAALDEMGLREDTLILWTSDNGTPGRVVSVANGQEIQGGKNDHNDAGTHVPLIANWPGTTPAGTVCDDLIDFSDFMPTLAEIARAQMPNDRVIDGRSFLPQLKGETGNPREWAYTEFQGLAWIRTQRWKLYSDGRFFDVENDWGEENPLPIFDLTPEQQRIRDWLKDELIKLRTA